MSRNVVTTRMSESLRDAVARMSRAKVRHLPVVDGAGHLVGIVTDRDLRHRLFAPEVFRDVGRVPVEKLIEVTSVKEIMSSPVTTVAPDADLADAARVMLEDKVGSLPVVENGRVVGILTETDLLRRIVTVDDGRWAPCDVIVSFP